MTRKKFERDPEIVRNFLREGDPTADGQDPGPGEISTWKRAMLLEVEGRHRTILQPAWIAVAVGAVLVAAGLIWIPAEPPSPRPGIGSAGTVADPGTLRQARTIHFQGPNGTRIIWQLDPDFSVPGT